jgi:hypothetical protein
MKEKIILLVVLVIILLLTNNKSYYSATDLMNEMNGPSVRGAVYDGIFQKEPTSKGPMFEGMGSTFGTIVTYPTDDPQSPIPSQSPVQ